MKMSKSWNELEQEKFAQICYVKQKMVTLKILHIILAKGGYHPLDFFDFKGKSSQDQEDLAYELCNYAQDLAIDINKLASNVDLETSIDPLREFEISGEFATLVSSRWRNWPGAKDSFKLVTRDSI